MRQPFLQILILAAAMLAGCATSAFAQSAHSKPQPPVGVDAGGGAIGLITAGIDYTLPRVNRCLARDGEGRLIAWDVVDRDPLPYRLHSPDRVDDELVAAVDCVGRARVVPVRIDATDPVTFSRALAFIASTPARVVVLPARYVPSDWYPFLVAAAEFKRLLLVVATSDQAVRHPAAAMPNVTIITASGADQASLLAFAHAVMLVACNEKARNSSLTGAALAGVMAEQVARTPTPPFGDAGPRCQ